jgi:hypothetical protein
MKTIKWWFGIDAALAIAYWVVVFYSEYFYQPHEFRFSSVFGIVLLGFMWLKARLNSYWLNKPWPKRYPYRAASLSVFVTGYLIFLSLVLAELTGVRGAVTQWEKAALLPLAPLAFFFYGSPVIMPIWLGASLAGGCCLRRTQ